MGEFSKRDTYTAEVIGDPKEGNIRIFRNGSLAIDCLPIDELLKDPQVKAALQAMPQLPYRSWYEEMSQP